jgi:hypothetical protein
MTEKKLYVVDVVSTFHNRHIIEAESLEHAYDEVTMMDSRENSSEPFSQKFLGDQIIDGRKISTRKFQKLLKELETTGEGSHWMGEKLIHKIDYDR